MQWMRTAALAALLPALALAQTRPSDVTQRDASSVRVEPLATLEFPWGMAHLPDGRLLITEKPGRLRVYHNGTLSPPIDNLPEISYREGPTEQGGLLDVAVDPDFEQNQTIYLSYVEEAPTPTPAPQATGDPRFAGYINTSDNRLRGGAVLKATLDGTSLKNVEVIWRQEPKTVGRGHFGHRLVFGSDDTLYITSGERMRFDPAQDLDTNLGKVVRINRDGSIPKDNPFVGKDGARGDIFTLGNRNILSVAVHPTTGQLWAFEMGPLGGDELNLVEKGENYGWPVVSNGQHYNKAPIPDHSTAPRFEAPIRTWTPVISPSGAIFYEGDLFPWRGSAVVGGLSSKALIRVATDGSKVVGEERIDMQRRIRDVIEAPDGSLLVLTDEKNGALLRVRPASLTREQ